MLHYFFVSVYQIWAERKGFTIHSCIPENCFTGFPHNIYDVTGETKRYAYDIKSIRERGRLSPTLFYFIQSLQKKKK